MSNELTVVNPNLDVAFPIPPTDELSGLNTLKLKPGNIVLIQPTTRETCGGRTGQFIDTFDNMVYDKITVVPLHTSTGRVYFPKSESGKNIDLDVEPLCKSYDGITPSPFVKNPISAKCATCPMSKWGAGKTPPACRDTRRLVCVIKETGLPAYLNIKSTSIKPYELALNKIYKDIAINRKQGTNLALCDYYFTLASQKAPNGAYYILDLQEVKRVLEPGTYYKEFNDILTARNNLQEEETFVINEAAVDTVIDAEFTDQPIQQV